MYEVFPLVAGIVLALIIRRLVTFRSRIVALVVCSVVFGTIASFISGELFVSWVFVPIDVGLVLFAAGVTMALTTPQRRWLAGRERSER